MGGDPSSETKEKMDHKHPDRDDAPNGTENSGAKRLKVAPDELDAGDDILTSSSLLEPLNPNLRSGDAVSLAALRARYESAMPYPHLLVDDFLDRKFLDKTVEEIKDHSKVDFKESDLFKFYQSMDLASLGCEDVHGGSNGRATPMDTAKHVYRLRQILYSPEWRHTVERVLGLEPDTLSDQVDCACNCHAASCHLLCHDDVIRTRKVSYILYLVDDDWSPHDGGALELYGSSSASAGVTVVPETVPSVRLTPKYNTLCVFEVKPGVSFHSVQEVTRTSSPRLSLQGWYHARDVPDNSDQATLSQLKSRKGDRNSSSEKPDDDSFEDYAEDSPIVASSGDKDVGDYDESLSERDMEYLARYLDPTYLQEPALQEMRERFEETSSLQLRSLFLPQHVNPLSEAIAKDDQAVTVPIHHPDLYSLGVNSHWTLQGPPHMQRYLRYNEDSGASTSSNGAPSSSSGTMLSEIQHVMKSGSFAKFLARITGLVPTGYRGEIRRFRPGRDYTVAHYGLLRPTGVLDGTLVFCAGDGEPVCEQTSDTSPDVLWQSDDVGGFECYIEADETGEDEQYKGAAAAVAATHPKEVEDEDDNDGTELLSVSAANNTLSLVYRDPGTMRFVKYLSIHAPSSRWDIALEYRVAEDDDDDGEEEEDEDTA